MQVGRALCRNGQRLVWLKYSLIVRVYGVVAFACVLTNPSKVIDMNMTAAVGDQSKFLQFSGNSADAAAADAHHLRQELLRQRQVIANKTVHPKKPFANPVLDVMNRVAGDGLLHLGKKKQVILDQNCAEGGKFVC